MTESMKVRIEKNIAIAKEMGNELTIKSAKECLEQQHKSIEYWNSLPSWKRGYTGDQAIAMAQSDIAYWEAVIEYLTEQAAAEAVAEAVEVLTAIVVVANKVKAVRRAVVTLANKLHKLYYSLSVAFSKAWAFVKSFTGLIPTRA